MENQTEGKMTEWCHLVSVFSYNSWCFVRPLVVQSKRGRPSAFARAEQVKNSLSVSATQDRHAEE